MGLGDGPVKHTAEMDVDMTDASMVESSQTGQIRGPIMSREVVGVLKKSTAMWVELAQWEANRQHRAEEAMVDEWNARAARRHEWDLTQWRLVHRLHGQGWTVEEISRTRPGSGVSWVQKILSSGHPQSPWPKSRPIPKIVTIVPPKTPADFLPTEVRDAAETVIEMYEGFIAAVKNAGNGNPSNKKRKELEPMMRKHFIVAIDAGVPKEWLDRHCIRGAKKIDKWLA